MYIVCSAVFLQDSVVKMERNPDHPLYKMEVFQMDEFKEYAIRLKEHLRNSSQTDMVPPTVKEMMPDVAHAVYATNDTLSAVRTEVAEVKKVTQCWPACYSHFSYLAHS